MFWKRNIISIDLDDERQIAWWDKMGSKIVNYKLVDTLGNNKVSYTIDGPLSELVRKKLRDSRQKQLLL